MSIATYALELDAKGSGREITLREWVNPGTRPVWIHLNRGEPESQRWIREESGLDEIVIEALLNVGTRPRWTAFEHGLFINLRGVNMNPGADPEDLVSMRIYLEKKRIITVRKERVLAAEDIATALGNGDGPRTCPELFVRAAGCLVDRIAPTIDQLDADLDSLEDRVIDPDESVDRHDVAPLRQQIIVLKRYLAPQRLALSGLLNANDEIFDVTLRAQIRELTNRVTRYVEDLDSARERAVVIHDEITADLAERLNTRMYVITVVAGIFLPLSFATGLLGINVGGIPGSANPWAFLMVCGILLALGFGILYLLRRRKWF